MDLNEAKTLKSGDMIYCNQYVNLSDGLPVHARVTSLKVWKTRPNEIRIRAKHGMYDHFEVNENYLKYWETTEEKAINPNAKPNKRELRIIPVACICSPLFAYHQNPIYLIQYFVFFAAASLKSCIKSATSGCAFSHHELLNINVKVFLPLIYIR